ncbi:hypothetical protein E2C01_083642 [Portunus trituberculatus]|uniref:Uncharacterized protein n=1 Tax=Portunus trituberculatus TaxID=210409 RepID=A0A5B7J2P5_PORTR|nr:hypothetical protein [Portunus trituberculatus]
MREQLTPPAADSQTDIRPSKSTTATRFAATGLRGTSCRGSSGSFSGQLGETLLVQECRESLQVGGGLWVAGGERQGLIVMLPRLLQFTVQVQNGAQVAMAGHVLVKGRRGRAGVNLVLS